MRHLTLTFALLLVSPLLHAAISGSIVDANGNPVAGATVRVYRVEPRPDLLRRIVSGKIDVEPLVTAKTSDTGDFRFDKVAQPTVDLVAEAAGRETVTRFTADGEDITLMMREAKPRRFSVTANGKAVPNAIVMYGRALFTKTGEDGTFELTTLAPTPIVTVYHPDYAPLEVAIPRNETALKLLTGTKLTGTIIGTDGKPAANLAVDADQWPLAKSGDDGAFTIAHAPAKWRELHADTESDLATTPRAAGSSYTLHLRRGTTVTGVVRDAKTRMPVVGMIVGLRANGAITDASGAFTFSPVLPGRYPFSGSHPLYQLVTAGPLSSIEVSTNGSKQSIAATPLPLISGTVVDEDRKAVAGAAVGHFISFAELASRATVTRRNGTFVFHATGTDRDRQFDVSKDGYADTAFSVPPGESKSGITVTLPRGVPLALRVIDGARIPVAGASLHVSRSRDGMGGMLHEVRCSGGDCVTANDGTLTVRVAPAKYDIMVAGAGIIMKRVAAQNVDARSGPLTITVERGVDVSGRVTYTDGKPITAPVSVTMDAHGMPVTEQTDDSGAFIFHGAPKGKVSLRAHVALATRFGGPPKEITAPATNVVLTIPRGGHISGHVVDASSGAPITDFDVAAQRAMIAPFAGSNAVHADDGAFTINDVMPGRVEVVASADGYERGSASGIDVAEGQSIDNVELRLDRAARVKGRVTSTDGGPLAGAVVALADRGLQRGGMSRADRATTDGDGLYELSSVPPGDRNFSFSKDGFVSVTKSVATAAGKESSLDATLDTGREVTGRVIDESGQPVAGADVRAEGESVRAVETDTDGSFKMAGLRDGKFRLVAHKSGYVEGRQDIDTVAQSIVTLTLGRGATVNGRITGLSAEELGNAFVSFFGGGAYGNTRPDSAGNFTLNGVRDGSVSVQATVGGPSGGRTARKSIEVISGTAPDVEIAFTTGFTVRGRVNGHGQPMNDFRVTFSAADVSMPPGGNGVVDGDGNYSVAGLGAGDYRVMVYAPAMAGLIYNQKYNVTGDGVYDIDLQSSGIRGRVTDRDGKPIPDVRVIAEVVKRAATTLPPRPSITDSDGRYVIDFVGDGDWHLVAQKEQYQPASRDITVAGSAPEVDFQLDSGTTSTVRVLDIAGAPLYANVTAIDQSGHTMSTVQTRAGDGVAELWLSPGHYQLLVGAQGYARTRSTIDVPGTEVRVTLGHGGTIIAIVKDPTKTQVSIMPVGQATIIGGGMVSGTNRWDHLPAGTYQVREFIPGNRTPVQTKTVSVVDDQTATVTFD
ncbi:MAG TPA: carboxypeptidase regulatory-like domain-containing protein [Thermoanaerobaculia bacterium]|jgi:protocatechuate 3,4-dioxygenase beta subunit